MNRSASLPNVCELRDALLPKLLSGELRVPAASGSMKASA
jgi:hypothetical protein